MKKFKKDKQGYFICEECGLICKRKTNFSRHIKLKHNGTKNYFDKWLKDEKDICKICSKITNYINFKKGYKNYCCVTCKNKYNKIRTEEQCIKIFGVKTTWQLESTKQKIKQVKKERYGDENYLNKEQTKKTKKERYGDENYNNQEKLKQTCLERYGVEYGLQNTEINLKQQKTAYKLKYFKDTNIYYRASFELDFLEKHYPLFPDIQNAKSIKYLFNGKQHYYFPDFYIPSLNLIIEIKNSYLAKKDKKEIKAKKKATIANSFKYIMIVDKNYSELFNSFCKKIVI